MALCLNTVLIYFSVCLICSNNFVSGKTNAKHRYTKDGDVVYEEIIIPHRITPQGEFISHLIPHHYSRTYYKSKNRNSMGPNDMVHYMVPLAGRNHHVQLLPSSDIVSPGMVVEVHDKRGILSRDIHRLSNVQCHYRGGIKGQKGSKAVLSTCHGLAGYIRTKRGYYLIEPKEGHDPLSGDRHPHVVYHHSKDSIEDKVSCDASTDMANIMARRSPSTEDDDINTGPSSNISELHIESLIVLDATFLKYHKHIDVENYVLTVFNMAHVLYHDASLDTNTDLAIVRMIRLEEEEDKLNLAVNKNANKTLDYFCKWQKSMSPGDDTHPNHHDLAILLTRVDICSDNDNCGILSATKIGGMCNPEKSAIICEDNGLRLGFVIAHTIGHTIGIPHDSPKESGCNGTLPGGMTTVMAPIVSIRTWEWSTCSSHYLSLFMRSGFANCLYDPPTDHSFVMQDILPGVMYGGDFQCREILGANAALCDTGIECDNLVCYVEGSGCIETHTSLATGTNCGEKKWCFRGECVQVGKKTGVTDGGWGPWSTWSVCSRSCGSGIASQERHCDNPRPARGGRYCAGDHKHHKICNTEPCDSSEPSFRDTQCAEFNEWKYPEDNLMHSWGAYYMPEENPCILFCINEGDDIASLKPRVSDGTKCRRGSRDVCIDGICKQVPCDLDLESDAVEDWCGVCHGDGSSCTVISGQQNIFEGTSNEGRVKLMDIPAETVNIKVEETEPSDAKIQLRSKDGHTLYIEGTTFGLFNISGAKAWLGNIRPKQEALSIPGPTCFELAVWIVTADTVTIKYSFGVKEANKRATSFDWDYVEWSPCSAQCGPGTSVSEPKCLEKTAGVVDCEFCKDKPKPKEQIKPCEDVPCLPRWMIGDWQPCSKCPHGVRVRIVKCVKPTGEGEGESDVIPNSMCNGPKPRTKEPCICDVDNRKSTNVVRSISQDPTIDVVQTAKRGCEDVDDVYNDPVIQRALKTLIDKDPVDDWVLTVHKEDDVVKEGCHDNKSQVNDIQGKEALLFINKIQKESSKSKSRV